MKEWNDGQVQDEFELSFDQNDSIIHVTGNMGHLQGNYSEQAKDFLEKGVFGSQVDIKINKRTRTLTRFVQDHYEVGVLPNGERNDKTVQEKIYVAVSDGSVHQERYEKGDAEKILKKVVHGQNRKQYVPVNDSKLEL